MSTDLRDPELHEALDRAVRHLDPDSEARLETVLRRGGLLRSLRLGTVGVIVALFVAGGGWGAIEFQRHWRVTPVDPAAWRTYRDSQLEWSMAHPSGWHLQTFHDEFRGGTFRGALVSNVDFEFRHPDLGEGGHTSAWDMRGLPPHAVVVQFQALARFGLPTEPPDAKFPLSLDDAQRVRDRPPYGAPQPRLFLPLGETGYAVFAWFGPDASEGDREIARQIVASITFGVAPTPGAPVESPTPEPVFFPTWDTSSGVPDALLEGATMVSHDGCQFARGGTTTRDVLLVWPEGFRFEEGRVLDASGREVATVGGPFRSGGGFTQPDHAETLIGESIPAACRSPGETVWLVGDI
ncbi:MAG: hypothetical protein ACRDIX_09440 [Actinomycetota bacterium]